MKKRLFNIIILLMANGSLPTSAAQATQALKSIPYKESIDFKGIYVFTFDDFAFGKMGIEASQTPRHYDVTSDIASTGLINAFVKHTSHTVVEALVSNFTYPDIHYETHYQTRKKPHYVKLIYKNAVITEEAALPPENPQKRPPVPVNLKNGAVDPLSFVLRIRRELYEARKNGKDNFTINVYDGHRLTEADFKVLGETTINYNDSSMPVIAVDVRRKLLAGFTDSELADYNPQEPTLHMYFTKDARQIPIRLEASVFLGTLSATLIHECTPAESCLLGNKE